jgi:hypothetical protein
MPPSNVVAIDQLLVHLRSIEAVGEATVVAGDTIRDLDGKLRPGREWRPEVTDEFANPLYVIHVSAEQPK